MIHYCFYVDVLYKIHVQYNLFWATTPTAKEKWSLMVGGHSPEGSYTIFEIRAKKNLNIDDFRVSDIM